MLPDLLYADVLVRQQRLREEAEDHRRAAHAHRPDAPRRPGVPLRRRLHALTARLQLRLRPGRWV